MTFSTISGIYIYIIVIGHNYLLFFIFLETAETIDSAFQAIDDHKNVISGKY